jgi:hypothetical protein
VLFGIFFQVCFQHENSRLFYTHIDLFFGRTKLAPERTFINFLNENTKYCGIQTKAEKKKT